MTRLAGTLVAMGLMVGLTGFGRADDKDPAAILDKAIKALGGEEKLSKVQAATWKAKGTVTLQGQKSDIGLRITVQGLDHLRQEIEVKSPARTVAIVTVLAGDKGWRKVGDAMRELDKDDVVNLKRAAYLSAVPVLVLPLKGKDFKIETAGEEKVEGKPAVVVKATGSDGKDFKLYFDKASGLPVKLAAKVAGMMGSEFNQEVILGDYKEIDGIKKATSVKTTRDGETFSDYQITEFKILDKVDPKTFQEP